jgi:LysR family glycine cleavage system transcriptional activator
MRRLPPLTALRVFEAVGRAGSVKDAATELNVTPAAISHQIRLLEDHVGTELFVRSAKGLVQTQAGREFQRSVAEAFDLIAESARRIGPGRSQSVRIHSLPSFASCWLVARLSKFYLAHPGIDVEITTVGDPGLPPDLEMLEADLAIRVGTSAAAWPELTAEPLVHEEMFPVCAPSLVANAQGLTDPSDLARYPLLLVSRRAEGWPEWLGAARAAGFNIANIDTEHGPRFDTIQLAITAAAEGMGVAIGRLPLVEDFLTEGKLVAPFALRVTSKNVYWLLSSRSRPLSNAAQIFREWLLAELGLPADPQNETRAPLSAAHA